MRVKLDNEQRLNYFSTLKKRANLSWNALATKLAINNRMLRSWRSGQWTLPKEVCNNIEVLYGVKLPEECLIEDSYWYAKKAGKKGALIRYSLYGNFGTKEGRMKGGLNSIKSTKLKNTNFKFRKEISYPACSVEFAEMIGILIGDGGISPFQVRVSLNLISDSKYAEYVSRLIENLFNIRSVFSIAKSKLCIDVVVSSKSLVEFLIKSGLPLGNKVEQNIDMPEWIKKDRALRLACLRGIFDTDGSVYFDKHYVKNIHYSNINIALTSASQKLLSSIYNIFVEEGFHPTKTSGISIRLRRELEVVKFFEVIGSNNPKHISKFLTIGGVPKWPHGHRFENG